MGRRSSEGEFPLLKQIGLKACEIRGDGNCLFNALSDQIFGHQNKNREIRAAVIDFMRENRGLFISFVHVDVNRRNPKRKNTAFASSSSFSFAAATEDEQNAAYEAHLETMAQGGTYGDNLEIIAFAKAYNTDVKIYNYDYSYYIRAEDDNGAKVRPVAHIAYHTWEHYSSVRNIGGPFTGLPQVQVQEVSAEQCAKAQAELPKGGVVQDWMVRSVMTSLPHLIDEDLIRKTLQESNGHVDDAVSKLLDCESSNPPSPGSSSTERDLDSDDEDEIRGPSKRQNRLIKEARKMEKRRLGKAVATTTQITTVTTIPIIDLTEAVIPSIELNNGVTTVDIKSSSLPTLSTLPPATSTLPPPTKLPQLSADPRESLKAKEDGDDDSASSDGDDPDDDTTSSYPDSSRSPSVVCGLSGNKSKVKQNGPKRVTARERKASKKAAQKQNRKTSKRNNAKSGNLSLSTNSTNIKQSPSPPVESVIYMKTLYI